MRKKSALSETAYPARYESYLRETILIPRGNRLKSYEFQLLRS